MKLLLVLVAVASGLGSALQAGSNSMLQKSLSATLWTMASVGLVLSVSGLVLAVAAGGSIPPAAQFGAAPWWAWLGGVFGLLFLFATVYVSPQLGAGVFIALVVTSSTGMSLVLDHFGLMGFEVHQAGIGRIAGALLMIAGVACIAAF